MQVTRISSQTPSNTSPAIHSLSVTDRKVRIVASLLLRLLSNACMAASIFVGSASVILAYMVNPVYILGIFSSITVGTIGVKSEKWSLRIREGAGLQQAIHDSTHFIPGKPLQLKNAGNDCWIGAPVQLCANLLALCVPIMQHQDSLGPIYNAIRQYREEQQDNQGKRIVSNVHTRRLREFLYDEICGGRNDSMKSRDGSSQEDSILFFDHVLNACKKTLPLLQQGFGITHTNVCENSAFSLTELHNELYINFELKPDIDAAIDPNNDPGLKPYFKGTDYTKFETLWDNYFESLAPIEPESKLKDPTLRDYKAQIFRKTFRKAPYDFMICLKRFSGCPRPNTVLTHEIDMPLEFTLSESVSPNEQASYHCDGFIMHVGGLENGHYFAYVYKCGKWWLLDDQQPSVIEVSQEHVQSEMRKAYIFHYTKSIPANAGSGHY